MRIFLWAKIRGLYLLSLMTDAVVKISLSFLVICYGLFIAIPIMFSEFEPCNKDNMTVGRVITGGLTQEIKDEEV
jgi:hypothetical protein